MLSWDLDGWKQRLADDIEAGSNEKEVGAAVAKYLLSGDYSEVGTDAEAQAEELFTYCTRDIVDGWMSDKNTAGPCPQVRDELFGK